MNYQRFEGGARSFFRRRARRLLPPYYASFGLSLLLIWTVIGTRTGTHWDISVPVDWRVPAAQTSAVAQETKTWARYAGPGDGGPWLHAWYHRLVVNRHQQGEMAIETGGTRPGTLTAPERPI